MGVQAFLEAAQHDPFRLLVQRFIQALFIQVSQRLACAAVHPIPARYSRWLLSTHDRMGDREFPLTQESLAQMLGVRRASVTAAAGALQDAGFIRYTRGRMAILDREGLENAACECYRIIRSEFDRLLPLPGGPAEPPRSAKEGPRRDFLYWNDDGELVAVRVMDWKVVFKAQENTGIGVWRREFTNLRAPLLFNLRADPFERGDESIEYEKWFFDRSFVVVPTQAIVAQWLESFKEFPIRQRPASFNLDDVMAKLAPKN